MDIIKSSFNTGEVSEEVYGRTDLEKYVGGCKILENFICLAHGPITRTPGKEYIAGTKDSAKKSRVIDFIFSTEQAYMLEFGDYYIRFFNCTAFFTLAKQGIFRNRDRSQGNGISGSQTF